jgi:hypothetical protein
MRRFFVKSVRPVITKYEYMQFMPLTQNRSESEEMVMQVLETVREIHLARGAAVIIPNRRL